MKKINCISMVLCVATMVGVSSCNNEEFIDSPCLDVPEVEVSTMGQWNSPTRSTYSESEMPVLRFRDLETYLRIERQLFEMSDSERLAYYKKLDFDGAYSLWDKADRELEQIFDCENITVLSALIQSFKDKYDEMFSFNEEDEYDATPYLPFTSTEKYLMGNIRGYVVIGDELIEPEVLLAESAVTRDDGGPIEPGFVAFNDTEFTISKGKYRSTMTLGRAVNGNTFIVKFKSKKKVWFWYKSVKTRHTAQMVLSGSITTPSLTAFAPEGYEYSIMGVPLEAVGQNQLYMDVYITYFASGVCTDPGSTQFVNVLIL